jgi:hypothetical protein
MNESVLICPKCRYHRQPTDTCPEYECPKCGVIYAKFHTATTQHQVHGRASLNSKAQNANANSIVEPEIPAQSSDVQPRLAWHSRFRSLGLKAWLGIVVGGCFVSLLLIILAVNFTDYGNLRYRYIRYINAADNFRFEESYSFLSQKDRQLVSLAEWRNARESAADMRLMEHFRSVAFAPDSRSARIISMITVEGKEIKPNYQTWVKENGSWYRAYFGDMPEAVTEIRKKFNKTQNRESRPQIVSMSTSWGAVTHEVGTLLISPKTSLVIANDGDVPISELEVKVEYFDKTERVVLSESNVTVVSSSEEPLPPGASSKNLFLDSSAGFRVTLSALNSTAIERIAGRIERRLYFRRQPDGHWLPLSTAHLVEKSVEP